MTLSNLRRLVIFRASQLAVEGKSSADVSREVIDSRGASLVRNARDAALWVQDAITAIRSAPDGNPQWSDEDVAGQIIAEVQRMHPELRI
jgi:hypothetical protein